MEPATASLLIAHALAGAVIEKLLEAAAEVSFVHSLIARLRWLRKKKALTDALRRALTRFEQAYPQLAGSYFDEFFLTHATADEIGLYFTRSREPDPRRIAQAYTKQFSHLNVDVSDAAVYFLAIVDEEIKAEEALQSTIDRRQIENTNQVVRRIESLITSQVATRPSEIPAAIDRIEAAPPKIDVIELGFKAISADLLAWPQTLKNGRWIERPELDQIEQRIRDSEGSATVLLGVAGSGKSALLARLASRAISNDWLVLAFKADMLSEKVSSIADLDPDHELPADPVTCVKTAAANRRVVLILDQLDALCDVVDLRTRRLSILLNFMNQVAKHPGVHIVASCRLFEFDHDVRFRRLEAEPISLPIPSWSDVSVTLTELGIDGSRWPGGFREILRVPQHLKLFTDYLSGPSQTQVFDSYHAMLDAVWDSRVTEDGRHRERAELLLKIARDMAEHEELWAPIAKYEGETATINSLIAAGILVRDGNQRKIGFTHQTLFDYARARAFVSGVASLAPYVVERQTAMFVRPQLWSALSYIRGASRERYHREMRELWEMHELRLHLRFLLIEFLGHLEDPDVQEIAWLRSALNDPRLRAKSWSAIAGQRAWFDNVATTLLAALMHEPPAIAWCVLRVLNRAWSFAGPTVLQLLRTYWISNPDKASLAWAVFHQRGQWDRESVAAVCDLIKCHEISVSHACHMSGIISTSAPTLAPLVVAELLQKALQHAKTQDAAILENASSPHEDDASVAGALMHVASRHEKSPLSEVIGDISGWYNLPAVSEAAPQEFLEFVWPLFVEIIAQFADPEHSFVYRYRDTHQYALHLEDADDDEAARSEKAFVSALSVAIVEFANSKPQQFIEFVSRWQVSDMLVAHRLLARGLLAVAPRSPDSIVEYILANPRRLGLGDAIGRPADTQALIAAVAPHLATESLHRLEAAILAASQYKMMPDDDDAKTRQHRHLWDREFRLRLLSAIPENLQTVPTREFVAREERELGEPEQDRKPKYSRTLTEVRSPMSAEQMQKARNEHILKLLQPLKDDEDRWGMRSSDDGTLVGGSVQASREFAEFAKSCPLRAVEIIRQLSPQINERPVAYALEALPTAAVASSDFFDLILDLSKELYAEVGDGVR